MSDRLTPGPDAKARYQAQGEKEFHTFFDEIPAPAMQSVARYLPSVDGFRKTSLAGIAKQKTALARKLSKTNANDRDFNGLYLIWRTWIDANFENPKTIHDLMDKLEAAADKQASAEERRRTIEQHVDAFLQKLKEESLQNHCTREQIERLFTFSPLPETPAARGLIAGAKGAAEVDRDATLSELPKRLQLDEDEIERIKSDLKKQSERLDQISASVEAIPASLNKVHSSVAEAHLSAQKAQDAVEALAKVGGTQGDSSKKSAPDNPAIDMRLEALAIAVESRRGEIRNLASKLEDIDTLLNAVAEVEGAQKTVQDTLLTLDQRVAEVGSALDHIKRDVAERQQDPVLAEQLGAVEKRLYDLEQRPAVSVPLPAPAYETKAPAARSYQEPQRDPVALRWDSLTASDRTDEKILQSHADLGGAIAATLQSLGVRKSAAQIFGEECAAAVIAKQAIFLKGSFATQTGRAIARVVGGTASVRIAVPIGLQNGEQLRSAIEQAFETERPTMAALVIEGINRTAFDLTKEVLCDCLDPGFDRAPARSVVLATISEGVASLPLEPGYHEIGPVFDLNCLDWRMGQPSSAEESPSAFSSDADKSLFTQAASASIDTEEAIRLANAFVSGRDPSIERAFATAFHNPARRATANPMTDYSSPPDHGVHATAHRLTKSLRSYIEAQYHIRNETLIRERRRLLEEPGAVSQVPFVESTPVYELGEPYANLQVPPAVERVLTRLAGLDIGLYPRPYVHQASALEAFFERGADLIVATGTGSGKTESFLMPIIGQLAVEGESRPASAALPGVRALLLYPMNALVNDQLSRIRRLFGGAQASEIISTGRDLPVRFASYTGRTAYPGPRTSARDTDRIEPLFEEFYLPIIADPDKEAQLRAIGQLPEKDLVNFFGQALEQTHATRRGSQRRRNWNRRLLTQAGDRELMTRHETQARCPELLITNYSMLEYMLMRPIERPIFQQTRDWLRADPANEMILVLDEAHMYRGAGGAEVALLLRRLLSRLDVPRDRVRFILTSASLGSSAEAALAITQFGRDLTGLADGSSRTFEVIRGTREERHGERQGQPNEARALHDFDLPAFERHAIDPNAARMAVTGLCHTLGWDQPAPSRDLADFLYEKLTGFGPAELMIESVAGTALPLPELERIIFGETPFAERATAALIALATFAQRQRDRRVLLPTRLHMFFRGLPALFACINPECDHARERNPRAILGRLHTHARERCQCGGRVYELATHRECGTAFLRGYLDGPRGDFLWHLPSGILREGHQAPLTEVELLLDGEPHRDQADGCLPVWIDIRSGRVLHQEPDDTTGFRRAFRADPIDWTRAVRFAACPVCRSNTLRNGRSTIMDHSTKGEAPFANLVKTQLDAQPAVRGEDRIHPNGGRKVLLFSDGRQKAARLARDIPREVEQDIFRQVLAAAAARMIAVNREPRPTNHLYIAVLAVLREFNLPMFDRDDARRIENEIERIDRDHDGEDLAELIAEFSPADSPPRYKIALLKQLCGRYYSLSGTSVGVSLPSRRAEPRLRATLRAAVPTLTESDADELAATWISGLSDKFALDREIPSPIRSLAAGYWSNDWGSDGRFERTLRAQLPRILGISAEAVPAIEAALVGELALRHDNGAYFLDPGKLRIHIDLQAPWLQCRECTQLMPFSIRGCCTSCASTDIDTLDPANSEYIRARKGFWREPVRLALSPQARLRSISVEEHTAQLSNRDNTRVHATTEKFELRFRDIRIEARDRPIDVLSCTTTMEVGIDIGSLVAVGLRNVPPQRENYQQRAGRAGRRGSSVSTVLTYAQNGPHDSYYYDNPRAIVAGPPRNPDIKIDNPKIARRHVASFLLQTFFHRYMDEHNISIGGPTSALFRALGKASDFFFGDGQAGPSFPAFRLWVEQNVIAAQGTIRREINSWLPASLRTAPRSIDAWIGDVAGELLDQLEAIMRELQPAQPRPVEGGDEDDDGDDDRNALGDEELLEFLFSRGLLPSYAFPTDLTSFLVERLVRQPNAQQWKMEIVERPQQGINKALSEYAPGRLIVINKETYRSGGVVANVLPSVHDRAAPLFADVSELVHCDSCSFVRDLEDSDNTQTDCPVCSGTLQRTRMIVPQVFTPEGGRPLSEDDREQAITYATGAQFPVPVGTNDLPELQPLGARLAYVVTADRRLVTANKGQQQNDAFQGFWICDRCGQAASEQPAAAPHDRPYLIEFAFNQPRPPRHCNGTFHNVFLGHVFSTDLLLIRLSLAAPMATDTNDPVVLRALEDALYSISEALRLAASRHPQLDLDPSEFGSGFRIVPSSDDEGQVHLDVYLYDTLSGGAGYADLAGRNLTEILRDVLDLLENCPAQCDRSCESCLRHYHNQHLKDRLDRFIGAQLLRYAMTGDIPPEFSIATQAGNLDGLARLLQLDGFRCTPVAEVGGQTIPLLVERNGEHAVVGTQSALVAADWTGHSLTPLLNGGRMRGRVLNDYILRRNLPDEHQLIRSMFPV